MDLRTALAMIDCDTPETIAAYLRDAGITGKPKHPCKCPIARHLDACGLAHPYVGERTAGVVVTDAPIEYQRANLTAAQCEFVKRFDAEEWPHLIENLGKDDRISGKA